MADYFYGSARVRTLENGMVGRERIARLLEAKGTAEALSLMTEFGVPVIRDSASGKLLREESLLALLKRAYAEVLELTPNPDAMKLWLYPYDCNNVKAAIKCFERKLNPAGMLVDFGTVDAATVSQMPEKGDYEALPPHMAQAAPQAVEAYARTGNPQLIDLILDRGCYADMLEAADRSKIRFATELVRAKIDLTNLMISIRIIRMKSGEAGKLLLRDSLIEGGNLDSGFFTELYSLNEKQFWERLLFTDYRTFAAAVAESDGSLTAVERSADDFWMNLVREARLIPFGAEVLIGYLIGTEYEVRNLRIILAGKEAGLDAGTIRERIRESYV